MGGEKEKPRRCCPDRSESKHHVPANCRVCLVPSELKLRLQDESGAALSGKAYEITWRDVGAAPVQGMTDASGMAMARIPHGASTADLKVGEATDMSMVLTEWKLVVHVAPLASLESLAGMAARLSNLGYLIVPAPTTASSDLTSWAEENDQAIKIAGLIYHRHKHTVLANTSREVYTEIGNDHDKS